MISLINSTNTLSVYGLVATTVLVTIALVTFASLLAAANRTKSGFKKSWPWYNPYTDLFALIRHGNIRGFVTERRQLLQCDTFWIHFMGITERPHLVITHPKDQAYIMSKEGKLNFYVEMPKTLYLNHGYGNMQVVSGQRHHFLRTTFSSLLSPRALESFVPYIISQFKKLWTDLEAETMNGPVSIQDRICDAQFLLVSKLFYGLSPDTEANKTLLDGLRKDFELQLKSHFLPESSEEFKKGNQASKRIQKYLGQRFQDVLDERRKILKDKGSSRGPLPVVGSAMESIADLLIEDGHVDDPEVLSDVMDNFNLLFEASHGTTMIVTTSTLYFLNRPDNEDKLGKLREEVSSVKEPTIEVLKDGLLYSEACIKEAMRMAPMVGGVSYVMEKGLEVSFRGQTLKGPMAFELNFSSNYFDSNIFPDPHEFKPQRWLPRHKEAASMIAKLAYKPFGAGRHHCLGYKLALMMIKTSLHCFASEPNRKIQYDTDKVKITWQIIPEGQVSEGLPGQVIRER